MNNISIDQVHDLIVNFLQNKYNNAQPKELNKDNYKKYEKELNQILVDEDNIYISNFLTLSGKIKKLHFDLSDISLSTEIKEYFNILEDNNKIQQRIYLNTEYVSFPGFNILDVVKCGFIQVEINQQENAIIFKYNSKYEKPSKEFKNKIEELYNIFDTFICEHLVSDDGDNEGEEFSKANNHTCEDIISWFEKFYKENNTEE